MRGCSGAAKAVLSLEESAVSLEIPWFDAFGGLERSEMPVCFPFQLQRVRWSISSGLLSCLHLLVAPTQDVLRAVREESLFRVLTPAVSRECAVFERVRCRVHLLGSHLVLIRDTGRTS